MPALQNSSSSSSLSSSAREQRLLRQQYNNNVAQAALVFNPTDRLYARGSHAYTPYPTNEEVYLHSNTAVMEDDNFSDLSFPDFLNVQRRVARHRFHRYRAQMNTAKQGLFGCRLEDWDKNIEVVGAVDNSTSFTASMGMALFEMNLLLRERVSGDLFSLLIIVLILLLVAGC